MPTADGAKPALGCIPLAIGMTAIRRYAQLDDLDCRDGFDGIPRSGTSRD
jgi:hypothetical protein